MRVRTKAKLAGKVKAANPGLTPSPAPGSAYRSRSHNANNDEANAGAHDDRDGNVVLSPFTPSPASTSPGAGTVRRKSRVPELDSAYKASHIGPGRDCTLDATLKEKGWNSNTVKFRLEASTRTDLTCYLAGDPGSDGGDAKEGDGGAGEGGPGEGGT